MIAFLRVISPGAFTTVQDRGRFGYRQFGVPPSGVLDRFSYTVSNMLVANSKDAAVLEFTFLGGSYEILSEANIALTGDMPAHLNGRNVGGWCSFRVRPGDRLEMGQVRSGCRAYLAVNGGFDVPVVMGSRSCFVGGRIGGYNGRALATDDILSRMTGAIPEACFRVPAVKIPDFGSQAVLRVIPGPQDDFFDAGIQALLGRDYRVSPEAGRSGYRLEGPTIAIAEGRPGSIVSEPSLAGSVQIPENGQPIILLNEQTVGGYAKIATVIQPDIDKLAQLIPGDLLRFEQIDLDTAQRVVVEYDLLMESVGNSLEIASVTREGYLSASTIQNWEEDPEAFAQRVNQYLVQM